MPTTEQGPRQLHDGPIRVEETSDGVYRICVEHDGESQALTIGKFNLFRLLAASAMMLGLSLPSKLMRSIKM